MSAELTLPAWVTGFPSRTYLPGSATDRFMSRLLQDGEKTPVRFNVTCGSDPNVTKDQIAEQMLKVFEAIEAGNARLFEPGEIDGFTPEEWAKRVNARSRAGLGGGDGSGDTA